MAVKNLRTRAFEIARCRGIKTDAELARVMEISHATVSRVQSQLRQINQVFIIGALRAFPDLTFEELFFIDPERAVDSVQAAERDANESLH